MNIAAFILCLGASVTAGWGEAKPCETMATILQAPYEIHAGIFATLDQVMPEPEKIRTAALVLAIDAFEWYGNFHESSEKCDLGMRAMNELFSVRGNHPMIVGKIQHNHGCAQRINPMLAERCKDACILVDFTGDLKLTELHPNAQFAQKVIQHIYARQK